MQESLLTQIGASGGYSDTQPSRGNFAINGWGYLMCERDRARQLFIQKLDAEVTMPGDHVEMISSFWIQLRSFRDQESFRSVAIELNDKMIDAHIAFRSEAMSRLMPRTDLPGLSWDPDRTGGPEPEPEYAGGRCVLRHYVMEGVHEEERQGPICAKCKWTYLSVYHWMKFCPRCGSHLHANV